MILSTYLFLSSAHMRQRNLLGAGMVYDQCALKLKSGRGGELAYLFAPPPLLPLGVASRLQSTL